MRIETTGNYINVPFMGAHHMCVEGSARHKLLVDAKMASHRGCEKASIDFHLEALRAPGCAWEHLAGVRYA